MVPRITPKVDPPSPLHKLRNPAQSAIVTMASAEHTADEAGGEAIFSSDGLPSLSAPIPPPLPPIGADLSNDDAVVEESSDPMVAFETFVAKKNDDRRGGWGVLSSSSESRGYDDRFLTVDDPRRRLLRLKAEMDELEAELATRASSATNEMGDNTDDDEFQILSRELKTRLESMGVGGDSAYSIAAMLRGRQADLSELISRNLEKFATKSTDDTGKILHKEEEAGEKGKIVYELYRLSGETLTASHREASLEERLRYLEMAVGVGGGDDNRSLLERVEEALRLAKEVDAKEVEKVAAKAKVIR